MTRSPNIREPIAPAPSRETESMGATGCLLRIYWMFFGNGLLALCAYLITQARSSLSLADVGFALAAVSLIVVRYIDVAHFRGMTAYSGPASLADWRRYAVRTAIIAVVLWGVVHGVNALIASEAAAAPPMAAPPG